MPVKQTARYSTAGKAPRKSLPQLHNPYIEPANEYDIEREARQRLWKEDFEQRVAEKMDELRGEYSEPMNANNADATGASGAAGGNSTRMNASRSWGGTRRIKRA
jgi:hypothetical protein